MIHELDPTRGGCEFERFFTTSEPPRARVPPLSLLKGVPEPMLALSELHSFGVWQLLPI